jgi:hypothetical protein
MASPESDDSFLVLSAAKNNFRGYDSNAAT